MITEESSIKLWHRSEHSLLVTVIPHTYITICVWIIHSVLYAEIIIRYKFPPIWKVSINHRYNEGITWIFAAGLSKSIRWLNSPVHQWTFGTVLPVLWSTKVYSVQLQFVCRVVIVGGGKDFIPGFLLFVLAYIYSRDFLELFSLSNNPYYTK